MMFRHCFVSTGVAVALLAVIAVTIELSTVDGFTTTMVRGSRLTSTTATSSSSSSSSSSSTQLYERSLRIVDETRETMVETSMTADSEFGSLWPRRPTAVLATTMFATFVVAFAVPLHVWADGQTKDFKFPPIDYGDVNRCILKGGSSMGQANAARDKLYDLRQCQLSGADATGYDLSGVIMKGTDLSKANLKEAQFSKGFLQASNFDGADFSNAIVDRANFQGSSLRGTIFNNAVLTGTSFDEADLENADFTEAAIGIYDVRNICKNPTLKGQNPKTGADTRLSVGCQ